MHETPRHLVRTMLIGLMTIAPLWITWMLFEFVLRLLADSGRPLLRAVGAIASASALPLAGWLQHPWVETVVALLLTVGALYVVGLLTSFMTGLRLIAALESVLARLPIIQTVYSGTKRFLQTLRTPPVQGQRVVLINFPSPQLKTLGFVTKLMRDADSGIELAAVYVPTSPNPTSGYIEIVPLAETTPIDWSVEEALAFVMTGGANAPEQLNYGRAPRQEERLA
ncbi:DUF502 domain-containing protein [Propionivibrio dicarboxylicus]|uniref:Uncharacterized membrane protein n=1 Tax=Propionivibrio dicarboxylicus TaxID=83767 RepID=A0A1G7XWW7_9RHOO|nr:DUF502 domain-containing protein [Propionivibrio dicarboxylicus]SDG88644.1 Uncharacterized membrane protein [Propionivibrio dicarboxylicus]